MFIKQNRNTVGEQPMYHNCASLCALCVTVFTVRHCVHCAKGKMGQTQFTFHFFSSITGIKRNMLTIIFLGLIVKLAFVSGDCDVGTREVKHFDWNKVGISVLT